MAHDITNLAALERSFRNRGYSFDIFVDPPGRQWLGFVHGVDEIVVPLEGTVAITVDGTSHRPMPGDEVFIPAGDARRGDQPGRRQPLGLWVSDTGKTTMSELPTVMSFRSPEPRSFCPP